MKFIGCWIQSHGKVAVVSGFDLDDGWRTLMSVQFCLLCLDEPAVSELKCMYKYSANNACKSLLQ